MNPTPDIDIEYVANLARIALTAAEKARFSQQLGEILHYVEKLKQVNVRSTAFARDGSKPRPLGALNSMPSSYAAA